MKFDKALTWFSNIWIGLVFLLNLVGIIGFFLKAPTFWDGVQKVQDAYNPFGPGLLSTFLNVALLSPAIGAVVWRDKRRKKRNDALVGRF